MKNNKNEPLETIEEMEEFYDSCNIFEDDIEFTDEEMDELLDEDY